MIPGHATHHRSRPSAPNAQVGSADSGEQPLARYFNVHSPVSRRDRRIYAPLRARARASRTILAAEQVHDLREILRTALERLPAVLVLRGRHVTDVQQAGKARRILDQCSADQAGQSVRSKPSWRRYAIPSTISIGVEAGRPRRWPGRAVGAEARRARPSPRSSINVDVVVDDEGVPSTGPAPETARRSRRDEQRLGRCQQRVHARFRRAIARTMRAACAGRAFVASAARASPGPWSARSATRACWRPFEAGTA